MKVYIGVDLHVRTQTVCWCDTRTGEQQERLLDHERDDVRSLYARVVAPAGGGAVVHRPRPAAVGGLAASGSLRRSAPAFAGAAGISGRAHPRHRTGAGSARATGCTRDAVADASRRGTVDRAGGGARTGSGPAL